MATADQLEAKKTKLWEERQKNIEELRSVEAELDALRNAEAIDNMSPALKRQVLEAAGVTSEEAFGKLGL